MEKELKKDEKKPKWVTRQSGSHNLIEEINKVENEGYEIYNIVTVAMGRDDILIIGKLT